MKKHITKKTHKSDKQEEKNLEEILIDEIYSKAINESFGISYFEELLNTNPELAEKVSRKYWHMGAEDLILENKNRSKEEEIENNEIEDIYEKITTDENFGISYFQELLESNPELAEKIAQNKWGKSAEELISENTDSSEQIEQSTEAEKLTTAEESTISIGNKKSNKKEEISKGWSIFGAIIVVLLSRLAVENKEWFNEYGFGILFFVLFIIIGISLIFLLTKKWFLVLVLFFGGLASCFSMIASIIYFQILGAIGFFILMIVCWGLLSIINDW